MGNSNSVPPSHLSDRKPPVDREETEIPTSVISISDNFTPHDIQFRDSRRCSLTPDSLLDTTDFLRNGR
jgi:hypothetical protein